jgi:hypothetical protein
MPAILGLKLQGAKLLTDDAIGAASLNEPTLSERRPQSLATEHFFYFFLRLRKSEVRRTVQLLQDRHPGEDPKQLARRVIASKSALSLLGGSLLSLPLLAPGIGQALKLVGVVGATSMLTRMHLYMILEIALLFGRDIDDSARVPEMAAVVAASGLGAASPLLIQSLELNPYYAVPLGALSTGAVTQAVGNAAIAYYLTRPLPTGESAATPAQEVPVGTSA